MLPVPSAKCSGAYSVSLRMARSWFACSEYFAYLASDDQHMLTNAFTEDQHPALLHYQWRGNLQFSKYCLSFLDLFHRIPSFRSSVTFCAVVLGEFWL